MLMLRDLRLPDTDSKRVVNVNTKDVVIAGAIVDTIFREVNSCVQGDRSKIKLNMFEKGVIGGMLNSKVQNGIKNFILNMNDNDVKIMLDGIQRELNKRKR